jgi:hypothetical protein
MNPSDINDPKFAASEEEAVDLLVDGELDESRRRELLLRLEEQPDGWRRCAMAFLEAQCWKRQMRSVVCRPAAGAAEGRTPAAHRTRWVEGRAGTVLAMAASFLIALGLGTMLRDLANRGGQVGTETIRLAGTDNGTKQPAAAPLGRPDPQPKGSSRPDGLSDPWQLVTLGVDGGPDGQQQSIRLPARSMDAVDEAWWNSLPRAMPRDVEEALQRAGHQVHQSRQFVPLRLEDGRQLVVPVDQIDVRYVGNRGYQ